MPLVAMTYEYMAACGCDISFLIQKLPGNFLEVELKTCGFPVAECSYPDYADERAFFEPVIEKIPVL